VITIIAPVNTVVIAIIVWSFDPGNTIIVAVVSVVAVRIVRVRS